MKKLATLVMLAVMNLCIAAPLMAQDKDKDMMHDGVMMKNGKMWVKKNGEKTEMRSDMTLNNGAKVTTNGNVVMTDGTTRMLKDGEMITMDGEWKDKSEMKQMKDKKMKDKDKDKMKR